MIICKAGGFRAGVSKELKWGAPMFVRLSGLSP